MYCNIQGDQEVSVHLMITIKKSGAQRLFGHPVVHVLICSWTLSTLPSCNNNYKINKSGSVPIFWIKYCKNPFSCAGGSSYGLRAQADRWRRKSQSKLWPIQSVTLRRHVSNFPSIWRRITN